MLKQIAYILGKVSKFGRVCLILRNLRMPKVSSGTLYPPPPPPLTRLNRINIACMEIEQLKSLWNHVSALIFKQTCDDIDQKMKIHYKRSDVWSMKQLVSLTIEHWQYLNIKCKLTRKINLTKTEKLINRQMQRKTLSSAGQT